MRRLKHADHKKFVETEGWTKKGTARSKSKTGDHHRYTLPLENGDVLYTRVSHGAGAIEDPNAVAAILRTELQVTEEDFYRCVNKGVLPPRPKAERPEHPKEELDAKLVRNLMRRVGLSQAEVSQLSKEDAVKVWNDYLASGGS